ncbi:MJ0042-type zinc finger domain-containing protein [Candidatus Bipolaricaulota bacterium]
MPSAKCPACGRSFRVDDDLAYLYEQVSCSHCGADLEVIDENPLVLEEIDG